MVRCDKRGIFYLFFIFFWLLAKQSCQSPRLHAEDLKNACNTGPLNNIQQRHNALFDNCSLEKQSSASARRRVGGQKILFLHLFLVRLIVRRALGVIACTRTHKQTQTLRHSLVNQHWNFCLQGVFLWERDERV